MGLKNLILALALIAASSVAQNVTPSISCTFSNSAVGYVCNLQLNNTDGLDDWTAISGQHLEGMTNADVIAILTSSGRTINVPQIICDQFSNLEYLDLTNLGINTVGENSFSSCTRLRWLRLWNNNIWQLPGNLFRNNAALTYLDLDRNWLNIMPEGLLAPLVNLENLEIQNNWWTSIPADAFATLTNLQTFLFNNAGLSTLNPAWFSALTNLTQLNLYNNAFTEIPENLFANLVNLRILDLSYNQGTGLQNIHPNAFRNLVNLVQLNLNRAGIENINPAWFTTLVNLNYLYMNFNRLQELPEGAFANLASLRSLSLWSNQLKIVRRNAFGSLANISLLDFEENGINAIDDRIFEDAIELRTLYMSQNVCASGSFFDFFNNRLAFLERLRNCFCNFRHYVEIVTGNEFFIFRAFEPGMSIRVNATENISITLMPVPFISTPRVSILLGIDGGTRSAIRIDGNTNDVVSLNTPNILDGRRFNDFRIVWVNFMVLVFREQDTFPFMVYNLEQFYPFTHYALRSPQSEASWNIQPLELPADTDTC